MTKPDFVIFDCDGVLVDSELITSRVLRDDLAKWGLDLALDQIEALFVGGTMAGVMRTAREMGARLPEDWLDRVYEEIFAALEAECTPVPGIEAVLDALDAAGVGYAIGSNGPLSKMDVTLRCCGLKARFEGRVYSAHDCAASKPAPDVYLKAAAQSGYDPARCAVIEDSATGAKAGAAAKIPVFGFVRGGPRDKMAPHCVALFDDMAELPRLLGVA
ncbi:MAG: HAD-IA family hydrolase [Sulfitobacter sp.]